LKLANQGKGALEVDPSLAKGLNISDRQIIHPAIKEVFPDLI
jgi:alanine dehydrogenase